MQKGYLDSESGPVQPVRVGFEAINPYYGFHLFMKSQLGPVLRMFEDQEHSDKQEEGL